MKTLDVVAPVYNEEGNIDEFIGRVTNSLNKIGLVYRIILIDDGSTDSSWKMISNQASKNRFIKGIKLSRNFGHHYALTAGLFYADADAVVVMDSDLQDVPEVIPELVSKLNEGYDLVFVNRRNRHEKRLYLFFQKIFYRILNMLSGMNFKSNQANFSIISRKVLNAFKMFPEQARFYGATINWLGFNRTEINSEQGKRFNGKSGYSFKNRLNLAVDIIISFSAKPLKIGIFVGAFMSVISVIMGIWISVNALLNGYTVEGWASVIVSIYFTSGIILMFLGILGTYVGRIFNEVKNRPLYIIDEMIDYEKN